MKRLSIVMPTYNEVATIATIIERVRAAPTSGLVRELIIVDDGSTDGTRDILRGGDWDPRVRLFEHEVNQGKGAAVRTALGVRCASSCAD